MAIMARPQLLAAKEKLKNPFIQCMPDFFFLDINECEVGKHNCHANAICNNIKGSFECTCKPGYSGNGVNCTGKNSTSVFFIIFF